MARLGTPGDERQLPLTPAVHYQKQGSRLRALLNRTLTANGITHEDLEADTGFDEKQIGRALREDGGAHPPLPVVACILAKDRSGTFISGLGELLGYDVTLKKPDLAAENRRLRDELSSIRSKLDDLLGGVR